MKKNKINTLLKIAFGIVAMTVISFIAVICFYIYMIYGIHPSDEGTRSVACTYDSKQKKYTEIEITTIVNQKLVKTQGTAADCDLHLKYE